MVGGRPVRSRLSRRSRVMLSASGDGPIPSFRSRARTKWSIGFLTQVGLPTSGTDGLLGGTHDQCFFTVLCCIGGSSGHTAPWSIHSLIRPTSTGLSGVPRKGIGSKTASPATRLYRGLSDASPGVDNPAKSPASHCRAFRVEPQAGHLDVWPMAGVAGPFENWL